MRSTYLAERVGLDKSSLSRYVNGNRNPTSKIQKKLAIALGVSDELFMVAQGQFPDKLYGILCLENPEKTLSTLRALSANIETKSKTLVEELARDVLFRYLQKIGRSEFKYPVDIRELLLKVYGLNIAEESFSRLEIPTRSRGNLCGLLIPEQAKIGNSFFNKLVLLNEDILKTFVNKHEVTRFTLAHEVYHKEMWDLEKKTKGQFPKSPPDNVYYCRTQDLPYKDNTKTETSANYFAGAILMPTKDVFMQVKNFQLPLDIMSHGKFLQDRYGVSKSALKLRLQQLGISYADGKKLHQQKQLVLFKE